MFSENSFDKIILLKLCNGFTQITRNRFNTYLFLLFLRHVENIAINTCGRLNLINNTVKSCTQAYCQCQIRISRRVRAAKLYSGMLSSCCRNPDQRTSVCRTPRNINRCLIAGNQSLIGIDKWIGDCCHSLHMLDDTTDKIICLFAQTIFVGGIGKNIFSILCKRHVDMHPGTVHTKLRFRHKGGMQTMSFGDGLYCQFKGHNIVSCGKGFVIAEINLMLGRCHFMMGCLHYKSHLLQCQDHISSCIFAKIKRSQVKITRLFMCHSCGQSVLICVEQEKFALRSYFKRIP